MTRPLAVLIAALGGEGGGVLTKWLVAAATRQGLPVQSTSIPGVAQRTGATTYYVELWPERSERRPVFSLTPGAGEVDLMAASELLEASRAAASGFVTAHRTTLVASTHRVYAMTEKMAAGDGRLDPERLSAMLRGQSARAHLADLDAVSRSVRAPLSAVLLGAIAGTGRLPLPLEAFEAAIRDEGKAVEGNLRGFRAGVAAIAGGEPASDLSPPPLAEEGWEGDDGGRIPAAPSQAATAPSLPSPASRGERKRGAWTVILAGARRCVGYQDRAYAYRYLDRLRPLRSADPRVLHETARLLALRMTYEDVIRVAAEKCSRARLNRIAAGLGASLEEPVRIVEFFSPGLDELCSLLPPRLALWVRGAAERRGWRPNWAMEVETTSIFGLVRLRLLAALRPWRPRGLRWHEEQEAIDSWLALVRSASAQSPELALEIAGLAELVKGYGDTYRRGAANFRRIVEAVVRPALTVGLPSPKAADAVASARAAVLSDPEGGALDACLAQIATAPLHQAAE
jgi:indolepyruvate ferredoxin oxidoreductase beta subunit